MMRFLRSTLFPNKPTRGRRNNKTKNISEQIRALEERIAALEEENKTQHQVIKEFQTYLQSIALVITTLTNEMNNLVEVVAKSKTDSMDIFSLYKDDDDGYIH